MLAHFTEIFEKNNHPRDRNDGLKIEGSDPFLLLIQSNRIKPFIIKQKQNTK